MAGTAISFDGYNLQTSTILTASIDHESSAQRSNPIMSLANANKSVLPFSNYPSKNIVIRGKIIASSITELDGQLDTFRSYFRNKDRNLDIGYNASTRRYVTTPVNVEIDRPGGLNHASFVVTLLATEPFGKDVLSTTLLSATGRTSASYTDSITVGGSAPSQLPIFTVTYSSITDGTDATISFGNNATGQQVQVTNTFASGDVVAFDSVNREVTVNGIAQDFSGAFPEFEIGTQEVSYSDDFTARTFSVNMIYYKRWF